MPQRREDREGRSRVICASRRPQNRSDHRSEWISSTASAMGSLGNWWHRSVCGPIRSENIESFNCFACPSFSSRLQYCRYLWSLKRLFIGDHESMLCRFIRRYAECLKAVRHRFASNRFASVHLVETKIKMLWDSSQSRCVHFDTFDGLYAVNRKYTRKNYLSIICVWISSIFTKIQIALIAFMPYRHLTFAHRAKLYMWLTLKLCFQLTTFITHEYSMTLFIEVFSFDILYMIYILKYNIVYFHSDHVSSLNWLCEELIRISISKYSYKFKRSLFVTADQISLWSNRTWLEVNKKRGWTKNNATIRVQCKILYDILSM